MLPTSPVLREACPKLALASRCHRLSCSGRPPMVIGPPGLVSAGSAAIGLGASGLFFGKGVADFRAAAGASAPAAPGVGSGMAAWADVGCNNSSLLDRATT